jgi:hypothetical protein
MIDRELAMQAWIFSIVSMTSRRGAGVMQRETETVTGKYGNG